MHMKSRILLQAGGSLAILALVVVAIAIGTRSPRVTASEAFIPMSATDVNAAVRVWRIGIAHDTSQVSVVLHALSHGHPKVRRTAALALGRLGMQSTLDDLQAARESSPDYEVTGQTEPGHELLCRSLHRSKVLPAIQLSIARIRSSDTRGVDRVARFEEFLGVPRTITKQAMLIRSKPVKEPLPQPLATTYSVCADPMYGTILSEIVAEEAKCGHDVASIVHDIHFNAAQRMHIQYAASSQHDRCSALVAHLSSAKACSVNEYAVSRLLVNEGEACVPTIISILAADLGSHTGFSAGDETLVTILGAIGDKRALDTLLKIAAGADPGIAQYARESIRWIETGRPNPFPYGME